MAEIHSQPLAHHNNMSTHNNVENKTHNGSTSPEINIPEVELLIKASTIDGRRKGACLFCQEYFMELYLLAELKTITLKVTTVDMQKPPPDFRSKFEAAYPPILIHSGAAVVENDQVERHIMKEIPGGHNLFVQDRETEACVEALYKRLKLLLTQPQSESARIGLLNSLRTIDAHLQKNWSSTTGNGNNNSQQQNSALRFLTGDSICCFDCELMPRLQHVRVAGEFFCQFHIPTDLHALWRYMANMYRLPAFLESCPSDQDIIHHYKQQLHLKVSRKEELEQPTMTKTVPAAALGRGVGNPANNSDAEDEDDE